jgi:plastocyanin
VTTKDFKFDPSTIETAPGEKITLTLTNLDDAPHTIHAEDIGIVVQTDASSAATETFLFPTEPGTYQFHCHIHQEMKGTIVVGEASTGGGEDTEHGEEHDPDTGEGDQENDDGSDFPY